MYGKVFASLWQGSMVGKPDLQLVFVYMLAHANADGHIDQTHEVISALTGIPLARVRASVAELEAEDARSRSPEMGGRRIVRIDEHRDWGWQIVNYQRYRSLLDEEQRRTDARERMRRRRSQSADVSANSSHLFASVRICSHPFAQEEVEEAKTCLSSASLQKDVVEPVDLSDLVHGMAERKQMPDRSTRTESARQSKRTPEQVSEVSGDSGRDPVASSRVPEYVDLVANIAKPCGGAIVSAALALCGRLYKAGIRHTGVLEGVARHWIDNRDRIRNRWAYYSPGSEGFENLKRIIAANHAVAEHQIAEQATKDWLSKKPP